MFFDVDDIMKKVGKMVDVDKISKEAAEKILESNKAINAATDSVSIAKGWLSGIRGSYQNIKAGIDPIDAIKLGHMKKVGDTLKYSPGAIAGSYLTAATGARILSGGGLYKDSKGETDIIGMPFF